jgi:hypothetical protein
MEIWRDIPGYIGFYQVSDEGRVRTLDRNVHPDMILSGMRIPKSGGGIRPLNPGYAGRLGIILCAYGKTKRFQVHRLVLMAFEGIPAGDLDGLHNDGDHLNNRLGNLRWGTHTDNMRDKVAHGTQTRGETHPIAKLTEDDVRAIRASRETTRALGEQYGVSQVAIVFIKNRKTWKHVA